MSLLQRRKIDFRLDGALVQMIVADPGGAVTISLHYEDALTVSQFMRSAAKDAKRRAGDNGRHWSAVGVLTDLNDPKALAEAVKAGGVFNVGVR